MVSTYPYFKACKQKKKVYTLLLLPMNERLRSNENIGGSGIEANKGRTRFFKKLAWVLVGGLALGVGISIL